MNKIIKITVVVFFLLISNIVNASIDQAFSLGYVEIEAVVTNLLNNRQ